MPIPRAENNLDRRSAAERIYETLLDWIIDGTLKPGEKIIAEELAMHFDASRTPVREAIQRLTFQKIINVYRNKMTCVAELDTRDISVWYRPLAELQSLITEKAYQNMTPEHIGQLNETITSLTEAIAQEDVLEALKADEQFHTLLLDMSGNEYIRDVFIMLLKHVQRVSYAYFVDIQLFCESVGVHQSVVDAMVKGDVQAAMSFSRNNWLNSMEELQKRIDAEAKK